FNPDPPITMSFLRSSPPDAVPYTRIARVGNALAFGPADAFTDNTIDVEKVIPATGRLGPVDHGVMRTAPTITSALEGVPENGRQWPAMWFDATIGTQRWAMSYTLTQTLIDDVANIDSPTGDQAADSRSRRAISRRRISLVPSPMAISGASR